MIGGVKTAVLERIRRDQREVCWTPDFMRLGNHLYMWLWAYSGQVEGRDRWCLANENALSWLPVFPAVRDLVLLPDEVQFRDQRVRPFLAKIDPATRYNPPRLEEFCRDMLLPSLHLRPSDPNRLVLNVRRGDYYASAEYEQEWGFDLVGFVRAAVSTAVQSGGVPSSMHIVSDDIGWCVDELGFLKDVSPVTFASQGDALSDFREVAEARRVILANSTFSYWAGYVGDLLGPRQVLAPSFFNRGEPRSVRHLRPHWTAIHAAV